MVKSKIFLEWQHKLFDDLVCCGCCQHAAEVSLQYESLCDSCIRKTHANNVGEVAHHVQPGRNKQPDKLKRPPAALFFADGNAADVANSISSDATQSTIFGARSISHAHSRCASSLVQQAADDYQRGL